MIEIDMKTVIFANIIINFVGTVVMFILWFQNRKKYSGIAYWVLDWILLTGGALLISLQGTIPPWESMILSNGMIVGGTTALYFGLRQFAGKKSSPFLISAVLVAFVVFIGVHSYFTYVDVDLMARSYNAGIGLLLVCLMSMWLMLKEVSPPVRRISGGTGIAFGAVVLITLIRLGGFALIHQTNNQFLESGKFDAVMVMLLVGAIAFLVFNLVLMVNRRLYIETEELGNSLNRNIKELQATFNTTAIGFGILANRVFNEVNEAFCQMLRYSREEIAGKESRMIYPTDEEYRKVGQIYKTIVQNGSSITETRLLRKDGQRINVIMSISAFDKNDLSQGVVLSVVDITERKRLEEKLSDMTIRLGEILAAIPNIIMEVDSNKVYTWANLAGLEFFGDDVIGKEAAFYFEGEQNTYDVVKPLFHGEENTFYVESRQRRKDGQKRLLAWWCRVLKDDDGNVRGALSSALDITERKQLEQEKEKFTQELGEKNTELERFTYTVSHDLKSPLVTIKTFLGYLEQDITATDGKRIEKDMLYMNGATDKMGLLLEELLEMSRIGRIINPSEKVTLGELIREAQSIVAGSIAERGVKVQVKGEKVTLFGDRSRLVEIWQNLVENAVKFMGGQASPRIDIGVEHRDGDTIFFVRDNGIGIEPRYQSKLFNLFEKINPKTEGTGMGLAITRRVVALYGGKIWVESEGTGAGSSFFFTLPGALTDNEKGGKR
jgi:PAS domain S-box-containing protein